MIFAQVDIPELQNTVLVLVIERDNLARMEKGDPITLESGRVDGVLKNITYPEGLRLLIAYEPEAGKVYEMIQQGREYDVIPYLMRGYRFKPPDGRVMSIPKEGA